MLSFNLLILLFYSSIFSFVFTSNPSEVLYAIRKKVNKKSAFVNQSEPIDLSNQHHIEPEAFAEHMSISNHSPHRHHNKNKSNPKRKANQKKHRDNKNELLVNTESGYVRGRAVYLDHHIPKNAHNGPFGRKKYRVNAWLGIPFAEKPVGDLRFKRPVPIKNWDGILDASKPPNSCYQLPDTVISDFAGVEMWNANTNVSEDCLYLNIWTPHPMPKNSPVMIWIYGGGFYSGTSTLKVYDPRILVAETQLIFVSIQYRVSLFGFLYMDHENAPGNQGLLDQYLALKWIHNNIQFFGGDNTKITIFGESAGSVSVSLHLLSPLSSNLFRNAILQSGSALADWALLKNSNAIKRYTEILHSLGCNQTSQVEMIECAKKVEPRQAIERSDEFFFSRATHGVAQFTFLPVVDNYFLSEEPINLLNRGKFKKCPILIGANKDEGNWFFVYAFPEYRNMSVAPTVDYELFKDFIMSLFYFYPQFPSTSTSTIVNAVTYRYTNWNNVHNTKSNFENLDDAAGDFHFVCPVVDFANIYASNQQDVYFYYYTHRSSQHYWPEWLGVMHGDEIAFVFGEALYPDSNYTYEEKVLARKMLKYWSNFVRYENPNGPTTSDKEKQVVISNNNIDNLLKSEVTNEEHGDDEVISRPITQTQAQFIEPWPKYQIFTNPYQDHQRAYLILNADQVRHDYNIRAEYCTFWGSYLPKLILSECKSCKSLKSQKLFFKPF
jgi:acetylcholinesterase